MKQQQFENRYGPQWDALESWLEGKPLPGFDPGELPHLYRQLCHHLALARRRRYTLALVDRLNALVLRCHQRFYGTGNSGPRGLARYAFATFPALVRSEWRLVLLSALLFFLPMGSMMVAIRVRPQAAYLVLSPGEAAMIESMYDPQARKVGPARQADTDVLMFGHYVRNNISIDFQCFASGLLLGLGSMFYMVFNGLFIGTVSGHLTQAGLGGTFWPFVAGHSALELTAAVLSGAAGLRMGFALLFPGRLRRMEALKEGARRGVRLLYGTAVMTLLAAFIEAFWSASTALPARLKIGVGLALWALLLAYFLLLGRGADPEGVA